MSLADAARCVAAATGPIKARRAYLDCLLNMKLASAVWPRLREGARAHFMRRAIPLTAGVSNVVVRDDWITDGGDGRIAEYIRSASTGPMLPLVISPTTLGEELNVGVTYRIAGFSRQKIDGIVARFMEQIEHPQGAGKARQTRWDQPHRMAEPRQPALIAVG